MGSFSMKGTLNAASCADMVVETVGSDGCKFRPFELRARRNHLMLTIRQRVIVLWAVALNEYILPVVTMDHQSKDK
jgi:hypothetical protein